MAASPLPRLDPDSAYRTRLSLAGGQLLAMAADNPTGAADIVDKACLCGAGFRPEGHGRPDGQAVRAPFREAEGMSHAAAGFSLSSAF